MPTRLVVAALLTALFALTCTRFALRGLSDIDSARRRLPRREFDLADIILGVLRLALLHCRGDSVSTRPSKLELEPAI